MKLHEEAVAKEPQWRDHKFLVTIVEQPHDKIELPKVILKFFPFLFTHAWPYMVHSKLVTW
jgi:hypothetical protein